MKVVVQRSRESIVSVDNKITGKIRFNTDTFNKNSLDCVVNNFTILGSRSPKE